MSGLWGHVQSGQTFISWFFIFFCWLISIFSSLHRLLLPPLFSPSQNRTECSLALHWLPFPFPCHMIAVQFDKTAVFTQTQLSQPSLQLLTCFIMQLLIVWVSVPVNCSRSSQHLSTQGLRGAEVGNTPLVKSNTGVQAIGRNICRGLILEDDKRHEKPVDLQWTWRLLSLWPNLSVHILITSRLNGVPLS